MGVVGDADSDAGMMLRFSSIAAVSVSALILLVQCFPGTLSEKILELDEDFKQELEQRGLQGVMMLNWWESLENLNKGMELEVKINAARLQTRTVNFEVTERGCSMRSRPAMRGLCVHF